MKTNDIMRRVLGLALAVCLGVPVVHAGERGPEKGAPTTEKAAYLGVATTSVSGALADQLALPKGIGLVVNYIDSTSPAAKVLQLNDVLHKLNDQLLVNPQQLAVLVRTFEPGEKVALRIIRKGQAEQVEAVLAEKEMPPLSGGGFMLPRVQLHPPMFRSWGGSMDDEMMDDIRDQLEDAGLNMDKIGEVIEKLRRAPFGHDEGGRVPPASGRTERSSAQPGIQSCVTSFKDGYSLTLNTDREGNRTLLASDKEGNVVFKGPINTPEEMEKVPEAVRARLKEMEATGHTLTPRSGPEPASRKKSKREVL